MIVAPGQGAQTPGFLEPWLEDPTFASRLGWLSTVAGLDLAQAHGSARAALSAQRAAVGWPEAPRPVRSNELLPERALAGDGHARRQLVDEVYLPLAQARGTLIETIAAYFQHGSSIEATGRALFVHANTVRYRLRQVAELTGFSPTDARDAFTLEIALVLGRQSGRGL